MMRITSVNCGTPWAQTFSFDPFGNVSKSGSISFLPTYSTATNRMTALPGFTPMYDSNGNLTSDSSHTYAWDSDNHPTTIDSVTATYDALGRMVEQNKSGTYYQIVYAPTGGKLAIMNGQTVQKQFVPLPAGATAVYASSGLSYYRHPDWLDSSRLSSTPSRGVYFDGAYAPFGEPYSQSGTTDLSFTGQNQDTVTGLYDFMFREYHPTQGRWISPDPAGLAAVDPSNPQTWNRYAYVMNNPMDLFDPLGMCPITDWKGRCVPSNGGVKLLFWQILTISQECTEPANGLPICVTKQVTEIMPTISFGGRRGDDGSGLKAANNGKQAKCISRSSLQWDVRAELKVLGWMAQRSGGVRGIGAGGAAAFVPASRIGGGGTAQAMWVADYLGQQGLYWSVSGGPAYSPKAGAGWIVGAQYMTSTTNTLVTVQDVVNSSVSVGLAWGQGFAVGGDVNLQTGVFTETVGFGGGGFGGANVVNIASGFIPICRE